MSLPRGRKYRPIRIGKAFQGYPVAIAPDPLNDGVFNVFFNAFHIRTLDLQST